MTSRFADPALILVLVFIVATVSLLLLWRAERQKLARRMDTLVKASRASRTLPETDKKVDPAQAMRGTRRPRSALVKELYNFLVAAGYRGTLTQYLQNRAILAVALGVGLWLANPLGWLNFAISLLLVMAGSYLAGARAIRKRTRIMEAEFPGAIDIMVRGILTGMPLIESMRVVATEAHPVLAREFQTLIDELALGIRFADAMHRMVPRVPIADIEFFAVVMGLQAESGSAVAETLESAAETMRSRRELRNKISVMSSEARSSAAIIGSLPILVSAVMAFTSPEYIGLLVTTPMGNIVALCAVIWASFGILVMRNMINFEI
jgi:tight adherence protein B